MSLTPRQDAELYLRRHARAVAEYARENGGLDGASDGLLLKAEEHTVGVANLLEAAADWVRDGHTQDTQEETTE